MNVDPLVVERTDTTGIPRPRAGMPVPPGTTTSYHMMDELAKSATRWNRETSVSATKLTGKNTLIYCKSEKRKGS